ncbi:MAG: trimethylamine corrinoid protein 2 [Monoglobaceae bacterium]
MRYKANFEESKERNMAYWERRNHDRPLWGMCVVDESVPVTPVPEPETIYEKWTDVDYIIKSTRAWFERCRFVGDSFPVLAPNLGPDFLGATFGTEIKFERDTSYSVPIIDDWDNVDDIKFSRDNKWWKMMTEMTKAFADDAGDDYLVAVTDLHPGFDGVVSLRGAENTCIDLFDNPEAVVKMAKRLSDAYIEQINELQAICNQNNNGCINWSGIWHKDTWYISSCDLICMISPDMFNEYVAPLLEEETKRLQGKTIFHLDGPGALKHLDRLLEMPDMAGIQWVYGAGQPSAQHWLPVLKKIQDHGKLIQVTVEREDIPVLRENLKPEGVYLNCNFVPTEEEAKEILSQKW